VAKFVCAQAGCPVCLEALLRENDGLVQVVVRHQSSGKADYADLIQEGRIGLWRAILGFDRGRGSAFSTYAWAVIRRRIWHVVAQSRKADGWLEAEAAQDSLTQLISIWQAQQIHQALGEQLACLPERLRQVILWNYGLEGPPARSLVDIGQQMGLTAERVRQLRNDALVLLRLPAVSLRLRSLCERDSRAAYQHALALNRAWQRRARR
jgi:RNA polymerase sigma factor (sigma-70 family)